MVFWFEGNDEFRSTYTTCVKHAGILQSEMVQCLVRDIQYLHQGQEKLSPQHRNL